MRQNKAIFLDRDGVINKMFYDKRTGIIDSPLLPQQIEFIPNIFNFLRSVKKRGYLLILISSQPGIGIKKISTTNFTAIQKKINRTLKINGVKLDAEYYCLHHPFASLKKYRMNCNCRKPNIGLFIKAIKRFNIDIKKSWLVGDGVFDIIAGIKMGLKTVLIGNVNEMEYLRVLEERLNGLKPDYIVKNLQEVQKIIESYE